MKAAPVALTPWLPLVGVVIGAVFGVLGVVIGSALTYWRERRFQKLKDAKDTAHLVALVAGSLEHFSAGCEEVAFDEGCYGEGGYRSTRATPPLFEPGKLDVEWRALPAGLMFQVLDLPYRIEDAKRIVKGAYDYAAMPPDFEEFFEQRQYQYAVLGADAARLAARLREHAEVPARPDNPHWKSIEQMASVQERLERVWEQRAQQSPVTPANE